MFSGPFSRKISGAFLLLTLLTVVTGALGLYFSRTVLLLLRRAQSDGRPLVRNLEELSTHLRQAIFISRAVSAGEGAESIPRLVKELEQLKADSRTALLELASSVEDGALAAEAANAAKEQEELVARILDLLEKKVAVASGRTRVRDAAEAWREQFAVVLSETRAASAALSNGGFAGDMYGVRQRRVLAMALDLNAAVAELSALQACVPTARDYLQLVNTRTKLGEIDRRMDAVLQAIGGFGGDDEIERGAEALGRAALLARDASDALTAEAGLFDSAGAALIAERSMTAAAASIEKESEDVVHSLYRISHLVENALRGRDRYPVLRSLPALLAMVIALTVVASIVLTLVFSRALTMPLKQLIDAMRAAADGDWSARAEAGRSDELGFLAESFNRLVEQVVESREEMERLNQSLESKVASRTADLTKEIAECSTTGKALVESERRYRSIVRNYPRGMVLLNDRNGYCLSAGGDALGAMPMPADEVVGRHVGQIFDSAAPEIWERTRKAVTDGKQDFAIAAFGRQWRIAIVANKAEDGRTADSTTLFAADVTDEMESRQKLIQADRLASLGVLVTGVAHEINNPNQSILGAGNLIRRAWPALERMLAAQRDTDDAALFGGLRFEDVLSEMPRFIESIVSGAGRIDRIVKALKDYARREPPDRAEPVDLNDVVRSALMLVGEYARKSTDRLAVSLAPELPPVRGDAQRLEQVLINLIQNACQALTNRAQAVSISTSWDAEQSSVVCEVADEGAGIDEKDLERITDPFFTTKREVGGTGLGLSISAAIVREHGGQLDFVSQVRRGTRAVVRLPAAADVRKKVPRDG